MGKTLNLGKKIRVARLLRGYSQENIATELGIKQQTYQLLESGELRFSRERFENVCKILKMDNCFIEVLDDIDFLNSLVVGYLNENLSLRK